MEPVRTPNRRDAVFNTLWLLFEQGFARVVGLIVGLAVARYLGPADFGALAFALTFVTLFFWMSQLGLEQVAVRELVNRPEDEGVILGSAFRLQLTGAALAVAIVLSAAYLTWGHGDRTTVLVAISCTMIVLPLSGAFIYPLKAAVRERPAVIARNLSVALGAALRVGAIAAGLGVFAFAGANALTTVLVFLFSLVVYRINGGRVSGWRYDRATARSLLAAGWPIALSAVAIGLNMQIDQVMVRFLAGEHAVGIYAAAVRISEATYVLPVAVCASAFPLLVKLRATATDRFEMRLQHLMNVLTWLAIPGAVAAGFVSPWAVTLVFGAEYAETAWVLTLHIWSALFVAQGVVQAQWFVIENEQRFHSAVAVGAAAINIAVNFVLVPRYGAAGAAVATLISYGVSVFLPALHPRLRAVVVITLRSYTWPLRLISRRASG